MAARVSSALGLFVSQSNVRAFLFDVAEVLEFPAGSLSSILNNAGLAHQEELCVSQTCSTTDELALCAMGGDATGGKMAAGYTPELLHAQLIESVAQCRISAEGARAIDAMKRAGYAVGLYGNLATPYKAKVEALGALPLADDTTWSAFSCEEGCVQPSIATLREFCGEWGLKPRQVMLVVGQDPAAGRREADGTEKERNITSPLGGGTGLDHSRSESPQDGIVNSARAIAIGMHCVCMRASAIPDQIVSCSGKAACLYLPDYTLAHFVGEVLGYPAPLDRHRRGFGPYSVPTSHVFEVTERSFAFVNHRAASAGHVLVAPKRRVARFTDLGPEEVADLWNTAQRIGEMVTLQHRADGTTFLMQDGEAAGQTVAHVHIHVVPRRDEDIDRSTELYDKVDTTDLRRPADGLERELQLPAPSGAARAGAGGSTGGPVGTGTKDRSYTELSTEAGVYRRLLERMQRVEDA